MITKAIYNWYKTEKNKGKDNKYDIIICIAWRIEWSNDLGALLLGNSTKKRI